MRKLLFSFFFLLLPSLAFAQTSNIAGADNTSNASFGPWTYTAYSVFDGTAWDRQRSNAAANISATTQEFAAMVAPPGQWTVVSTSSASATAPSASKAAGAAGVRHVATSVTVCASDTAAFAVHLANLRDGATGAGTILWTGAITLALNTSQCVTLGGLNIFGTAATAMTLEFAAAGAATTTWTVTLTGYSVQ